MKLIQLAKPTLFVVLIAGIAAAGYLFRGPGMPRPQPVGSEQSLAPTGEENAPSNTIIVSDQAQKNLVLSAKPLQAGVFWKTITIQGMVVDRPGFSDREVVSPAVGIVSRIFHVPGDMVQPGEKLFTVKLASEALQLTQSELFKTSKNILLAEARRERLIAGGQAIAQVRVIEVESEIARLEAAAQAYRQGLYNRGISPADVNGVADGRLLSEITLFVPPRATIQGLEGISPVSASTSTGAQPLAYEVRELKVDLGEHVQAGQTLCHLSNHQWLAIEGRAFRDETSLLERSVQENWPVEVDFQEDASAIWPAIDQEFLIRYIANTIDPVARTFGFQLPLENQYKTVDHGDRTQLLWRFRPGQKVLLRIRVEKLEDVFVLPTDAVVLEGPEAYVFTQNVNTFERKSVHVLLRDRNRVVLANDGSLPTYARGQERSTIPAVVRNAAPQLNRMTKAGSSSVPKGFHIHADGSLHKNEDEVK